MNLRKTTLAAVFALTASAFAVDFGGFVNNTSDMFGTLHGFSNLNLDQTNEAGAWVRVPFNNSGSQYFTAQANGKFNYVSSFDTSKFTMDLDILKYSGTWTFLQSSSANVDAGRFYISDTTGIIFTQNCDGVYGVVNFPWVSTSLYAGWTGLLNAQNVTILNKPDSTWTYSKSAVYALAAPYFVGMANVTLPYILFNQTIGLQGMCFIGTGAPTDTMDGTAGYNRFYGTVTLTGPLASTYYYTLNSTMETEDGFQTFGNLSTLTLDHYSTILSGKLSLYGIYASGNQNVFSTFHGFTSNVATVSLEQPEYSGLIKAGADFSFKPLSMLFLGAGADVVFRWNDDNEKNIHTFKYNGLQWHADASIQILSDFSVAASAGQYFDPDLTVNRTDLTVKAVLAF